MARLTALEELFADRARTADPPLGLEELRHDVSNHVFRSLAEWQDRAVAAVVRGIQQTLVDFRTTEQQGGNVAEERRRLKAGARRLRAIPKVVDQDHPDLYFWIISLYLYGKVVDADAVSREEGDRLASLWLGKWLRRDPIFFLDQVWVRALLSYWLQTEKPDARGRIRKLDEVFYGPANKKGKRRGRTQTLIEERAWAIYVNVTQLLAAGTPRKAALIDTARQLKAGTLGTFASLKDLTVPSLERIYYARKRTIDVSQEDARQVEIRRKQLQEEPLLARQ